MTGVLKTTVLGKVTRVDSGTAKTGKVWCRVSLSVSLYNYSTKKYDQRMVNVAGFDAVAEAMKKRITPGCALWAEGEAKAGKPFKTNNGTEIVPLDLFARDWSVAGVIPERPAEVAEDTDDDADPFPE